MFPEKKARGTLFPEKRKLIRTRKRNIFERERKIRERKEREKGRRPHGRPCPGTPWSQRPEREKDR